MLFGSIAEIACASEVDLEASSVDRLRELLILHVPKLRDMRYAIAVDRRIIADDLDLNGSEEIAVLPPFAGG